MDTLIPGCTHYPVLKDTIDGYFAGRVRLVDSAEAVAIAVSSYLDRNFNRNRKKAASAPAASLYVTDAPERVRAIARKLLERDDVAIENVEL